MLKSIKIMAGTAIALSIIAISMLILDKNDDKVEAGNNGDLKVMDVSEIGDNGDWFEARKIVDKPSGCVYLVVRESYDTDSVAITQMKYEDSTGKERLYCDNDKE